MEVSIHLKTQAEDDILDRLFLNYYYDLSQWDEQIFINEHGLPYWKPFGEPTPTTNKECVKYNWWIRDKCLIYIIHVGKTPAGFGMVCSNVPHMPKDTDFELVDFYVMPKFRRQGYGKLAASKIFDLHRGRWVLYQLDGNTGARKFWQHLLGEYTRGQYTNSKDTLSQTFENTLLEKT